MKTKQIKVSTETAKKLDIIRGQEQLTYDAAIQALFQSQVLLRLLGKPEDKEDRDGT